MQEVLRHYIQENAGLSADEAEIILSLFTPLYIKGESILLNIGQITDFLVFITDGVMRMSEFDNKGNDITKFFFKEEQFVTNLDSYNSGKPSKFYIRTITPCKLLMIKKKDTLRTTLWTGIFNEFVQKELSRKIQDQYYLRNHNANEKYKRFVIQNGDIVNRVPLQYIASYLGIAPQSLSRIRRLI